MSEASASRPGLIDRLLGLIERVGNKLPDPAVLFVIALVVTWVASAIFGGHEFEGAGGAKLQIVNQLSGQSLMAFLSNMVTTFTGFHPLGVVLVALLGVGVAEHSGYINAALKAVLRITPKTLLTPMLILVGILSHTAADAGYVLVIPLGGLIFHAAGRHPLAGIAAAFAGVSGGFSANFIPSAIDPLLQGLTQSAGQIIQPDLDVNPLCNWYFTGLSSFLIIGLGWYLTAFVIEPRLKGTAVDAEESSEVVEGAPTGNTLTPSELRGLLAGTTALLLAIVTLVLVCLPESSPFRDPDAPPKISSLVTRHAPLMTSIVPLIFLFFLIPGVVHGYASGTFKSHRDVINGMSQTMSTMGYYIVMAFFAALFIAAFGSSGIGAWLSIAGAGFLQSLGLPGPVTLFGIILIVASVNLLVGSASAKWALLAPILVPMLMQLGFSPELTQAAYRVGDSTTNIITPLMPYFPLVVVFCQRYVKSSGIGTLTAMMLPYSITFLVCWTVFLVVYWKVLGLPLGLQAGYVWPPVG
jgi:aminobenzoyl-glutamate transport protein